MSDVGIFIPTRLGSTRLPKKPLADIHGKQMLLHVAEKAKLSNCGDVIVACAEQELVDISTANGFEAVLTDPEINTGTDRIYAAYKKLGRNYKYIVNLQGDIPSINPNTIKVAVDILKKSNHDISTVASIAASEREKTDPNTVRAIVAANGKALYFTRAALCPHGEGELYHHIGLYVYRAEALEKFVKLPQSPLEKREKLEQLRALENDMTIGIGIVDDFAIGVDTPEDLEVVRKYMK
jgi:3-deoxy-manno-octulosonate cytidylyltransferase (CMP-KDO synthetase)